LARDRRRVVVLGSTGSVGRAALEVAEANPDAFDVIGLSAHTNVGLLAEQARRHGVAEVAVAAGPVPDDAFRPDVEVGVGPDALDSMASRDEADVVVNALVGASGLRPALAALRAGKRLALANKESLVAAGHLIVEAAAESGAEIIPIDSEHSALFRCLRGMDRREIAGVVLTASGGPVRDVAAEDLGDVTVARVLDHPTWSMGEKVTVDSATLFNKGLEVIEAHWLFGMPYESVGVVLHRQSIVHSLVRLVDGSFLAQLGAPDMRVPIQYAMFYPDPPRAAFESLRADEFGTLTFDAVDTGRYPCFDLIVGAARSGGLAPAIAATADEVAVDAFIGGRIRFAGISEVIERTLSAIDPADGGDLESVLLKEAEARRRAETVVELLSDG